MSQQLQCLMEGAPETEVDSDQLGPSVCHPTLHTVSQPRHGPHFGPSHSLCRLSCVL